MAARRRRPPSPGGCRGAARIVDADTPFRPATRTSPDRTTNLLRAEKLDPRREPSLQRAAQAQRDLARATRLVWFRRSEYRELAARTPAGFCIVANTGLITALPLPLPARPKQERATVH